MQWTPVKAIDQAVRVGHARLEAVRHTLGHSDEWLFLTVQDKQVATIEVYTDADWAGDAELMISTSQVFTRIDAFTIGMNAQLQDTHAQSSLESEFYELHADGLCVKAIVNDLGMRAKINLQGSSKRTRHVRSRSVASTDRNESGGHRDETLAKSQIGIPV